MRVIRSQLSRITPLARRLQRSWKRSIVASFRKAWRGLGSWTDMGMAHRLVIDYDRMMHVMCARRRPEGQCTKSLPRLLFARQLPGSPCTMHIAMRSVLRRLPAGSAGGIRSKSYTNRVIDTSTAGWGTAVELRLDGEIRRLCRSSHSSSAAATRG